MTCITRTRKWRIAELQEGKESSINRKVKVPCASLGEVNVFDRALRIPGFQLVTPRLTSQNIV